MQLLSITLLAITSQALAQLIDGVKEKGLELHNSYRKTHKADPLKLSDRLQKEAERCAEHYVQKGTIDHSCKTENAGENLYQSRGNPTDAGEVAGSAVKAWYEEKKLYNWKDPASNSKGPQFTKVGHFTQVVWKATKELGFAAFKNDTFVVAVGKYSPPGNVEGQFADNVMAGTGKGPAVAFAVANGLCFATLVVWRLAN